ncbi:MAG TPA: glycosyltransferase family 4 protein [bacterium]|nr:glycosyltransferase family 4 protein [bacterium]HPR88687.1 glycosyltransferase family 4 protein [bacterium]
MAESGWKVLQLRSHAGFYGVEKTIVELAAGLRSRGHEVTVGIIQSMRLDDQVFQNIAAQAGLPVTTFSSASPYDRATIARIRAWIAAAQPDLIHSHGYKADVVAWAAARRLGIPLVSTCHPWLDTGRDRRAAFYALVDKLVLLRFDRVIAVSEEVRSQCRVGFLRQRSIPVIANGVALPPPLPQDWQRSMPHQLGCSPAALILGCVARLAPEKGHLHLLQAFAGLTRRLPRPLELLLIGDGPERPSLQQRCRELGIAGQVHFLGHRAEVPSLLPELDLFILPSLGEGVPLALLEAMAAGLPAIATAVGGVPEVLDSGRAGLLVPPGDSAALAAAIESLATDAALRRTLGQCGRDRIVAAYSRAAMCARYEKEYAPLIVEKRGRG